MKKRFSAPFERFFGENSKNKQIHQNLKTLNFPGKYKK